MEGAVIWLLWVHLLCSHLLTGELEAITAASVVRFWKLLGKLWMELLFSSECYFLSSESIVSIWDLWLFCIYSRKSVGAIGLGHHLTSLESRHHHCLKLHLLVHQSPISSARPETTRQSVLTSLKCRTDPVGSDTWTLPRNCQSCINRKSEAKHNKWSIGVRFMGQLNKCNSEMWLVQALNQGDATVHYID